MLPPYCFFWLAAAGLLLMRTRRRRLGAAVLAVSLASLYVLSAPLTVTALLGTLDRHPPLPPGSPPAAADAVLVLSGGSREGALEYGGDTVGPMTLDRLRYGAWLSKRTGRPIFLTGSTAAVMARALPDFGVSARWVEDQSENTHEHAVKSAGMLRAAGIERVYLVTHYWHMPRAVAVFDQIEVEVVPAPMGFSSGQEKDLTWLLPSRSALSWSAVIAHEWIGRLWYRVRYGY